MKSKKVHMTCFLFCTVFYSTVAVEPTVNVVLETKNNTFVENKNIEIIVTVSNTSSESIKLSSRTFMILPGRLKFYFFENVTNNLKLLDFGIFKTVSYAAPEEEYFFLDASQEFVCTTTVVYKYVSLEDMRTLKRYDGYA